MHGPRIEQPIWPVFLAARGGDDPRHHGFAPIDGRNVRVGAWAVRAGRHGRRGRRRCTPLPG